MWKVFVGRGGRKEGSFCRKVFVGSRKAKRKQKKRKAVLVQDSFCGGKDQQDFYHKDTSLVLIRKIQIDC